jgi:hypothetical protein
MPEAGAVERNDAAVLGQAVDQARYDPIFHHGAVAVQQHDRVAFSLIEIMEANSVDRQEFAERRIGALRFLGAAAIVERGSGECPGCGKPGTPFPQAAIGRRRRDLAVARLILLFLLLHVSS